jgi:hypothetical protein
MTGTKDHATLTSPEPRYSMVIEWSAEDAAFIATVPELSG